MTLDDIEPVCHVEAEGVLEGDGVLLHPEANTNITCGKTVIPAVRYAIGMGESRIVTRVTTA